MSVFSSRFANIGYEMRYLETVIANRKQGKDVLGAVGRPTRETGNRERQAQCGGVATFSPGLLGEIAQLVVEDNMTFLVLFAVHEDSQFILTCCRLLAVAYDRDRLAVLFRCRLHDGLGPFDSVMQNSERDLGQPS